MNKEIIKFNESLKLIDEKYAKYETFIIDDSTEEGIKFAKDVQAEMNNKIQEIEEIRKDFKKELLIPYEENLYQFTDLTNRITKYKSNINLQLNDVETKRRQEKYNGVIGLIDEMCDGLVIEDKNKEFIVDQLKNKRFNDKWLNKTMSMNKIEKDIQSIIDGIVSDLNTIEMLDGEYIYDAYINRGHDLKGAIEFDKIKRGLNDNTPKRTLKPQEKTYQAIFTTKNKDDLEQIKKFAEVTGLKLEIR